MSLGLLLVLIWSNDNPLFGGEVDTVIPALFVGALAAIARMTPAPSVPVEERGPCAHTEYPYSTRRSC